MADTIFTNQTPATDDQDFSTHHLGLEFTVSVDRNVIGGRAWVPNAGRPANFWWQLWRVTDQVLLAEINLNTLATPSNNTWMTFTSASFVTPGDIAIVTSHSYICNVFSGGAAGGHFVYTDPGTFPLTNGALTASTGRFRTGGAQSDFPSTSYGAFFFADVQVDVDVPPPVGTPAVWHVGPPEAKWAAGVTESKWQANPPEPKWAIGTPEGD